MQALTPSHNAFVCVRRQDVEIAGTKVPVNRMAILEDEPVHTGVRPAAKRR